MDAYQLLALAVMTKRRAKRNYIIRLMIKRGIEIE